MKAFLLALALLLPGTIFADGTCEASVGSYATILSNVVMGSNATPIDVSAIPVVFIKSAPSNATSTSQLQYWFTDDGNTTSTNIIRNKYLLPHGSWCIEKQGAYFHIGVIGKIGDRATVKYAAGAVAAVTGAVTISGSALDALYDLTGTARRTESNNSGGSNKTQVSNVAGLEIGSAMYAGITLTAANAADISGTARRLETLATNLHAMLSSTAGTWERLTATAYTGLTTNAATTLSVTFTAGTAAYSSYLVLVSVDAGASAVRGLLHLTATPPSTLSATAGPIYYQGDNQAIMGYLPVDRSKGAWFFSMFATALSGATSGTVFIQIFGR